MIPAGTLPDEQPTQWRAGAAADADGAATTAEQMVPQVRHMAVRESLQILVADTGDRQLRRDLVLMTLSLSVEKQARLSGLGRHSIARRVVA